jgi:hypothetical protein
LEISDRLATAALPLILAGIDELLLRRGFQRRAHDECLDEHRYFGWDREHGVIGNLIDASYPERGPHMLNLGIEVYLRRPPGRDLTLDGTSINYLNGRLLTYEFPMWRALSIRSPRRLSDIIVEETDRALAWFDRYATPALCLERLASPERNGVRLGTAPWTEAKRLLEALVAKGS